MDERETRKQKLLAQCQSPIGHCRKDAQGECPWTGTVHALLEKVLELEDQLKGDGSQSSQGPLPQ